MNEAGVREMLPKIISAFQKFKSNARESIGDGEIERSALAKISPYIFGDKSPLLMMGAMEKSKRIEAQTFYNLCFMLHEFIPEMVVATAILQELVIPEPQVEWLTNEQWFDNKKSVRLDKEDGGE